MRTWVQFPSPPPTFAKASPGKPVILFANPRTILKLSKKPNRPSIYQQKVIIMAFSLGIQKKNNQKFCFNVVVLGAITLSFSLHSISLTPLRHYRAALRGDTSKTKQEIRKARIITAAVAAIAAAGSYGCVAYVKGMWPFRNEVIIEKSDTESTATSEFAANMKVMENTHILKDFFSDYQMILIHFNHMKGQGLLDSQKLPSDRLYRGIFHFNNMLFIVRSIDPTATVLLIEGEIEKKVSVIEIAEQVITARKLIPAHYNAKEGYFMPCDRTSGDLLESTLIWIPANHDHNELSKKQKQHFNKLLHDTYVLNGQEQQLKKGYQAALKSYGV
jgi:hypothetical protein